MPTELTNCSVLGIAEDTTIITPLHTNFSWIAKISTVTLNVCGSDNAQRIEISTPSQPPFKSDFVQRKKGEADQNRFTLSSSGTNEKLLTVDFSSDRKSFHVMEPDSTAFIGFFTVQESLWNARVEIHNVIDEQVYFVIPTKTPSIVVIRSQKGEELGRIKMTELKWTQYVEGQITLNYSSRDEEVGSGGSREKAILLGFLISLGLVGLDYWKRSSSGLWTFYIFSVLLFSLLALFIYSRFK